MSIAARPLVATRIHASLRRRLASLLYEAFLLTAILLVAGFAYALLLKVLSFSLPRISMQAYLFLVCGFYFTWCWNHGGQTLPMKTWRIVLVSSDYSAVSIRRAILRFTVACVAALLITITLGWGKIYNHPEFVAAGVAFAAVMLGWPLVDRERQFLHDRLAGTRIINAESPVPDASK